MPLFKIFAPFWKIFNFFGLLQTKLRFKIPFNIFKNWIIDIVPVWQTHNLRRLKIDEQMVRCFERMNKSMTILAFALEVSSADETTIDIDIAEAD